MTMKIFIVIWVMASFGVVAEYHCFAGVAFYSGDRVGMFETVYWTTWLHIINLSDRGFNI
jgi:hypothetical protein